MRLTKCFKHAFEMVVHSKVRSWLTIIGIVIGVAAVIAITSIGDTFQSQINSQLGNLGGDLLTLRAGFSRGGNVFQQRGPGGFEGGGGGGTATTTTPVLARSDVQALRGIPDVLYLDTEISGSVNITYLAKTGKVSVTGVDPAVWSHVTTTTIAQGRMLDSADQNVIVIGGRLSASYFSKPLGINQVLNIQGNAFRVVGVLSDQSNSIYMPIQSAYQVIPEKVNGQYDTIIIKIRDESQLDSSMAAIQNRLMMLRHVTNTTMDFSLTSNAQIQQTRAATLSTMTTFLLAIAAVSLIVGSVGVANTMFTSVIEKTKEIGIMKAIGARNRDILFIFLFNSALIGLIGGVLGILLGMLLSSLLPSLLGNLPVLGRGASIVALRSVLMALGVSVGVGIVAGIIPAYQASKLKPVDALRYE